MPRRGRALRRESRRYSDRLAEQHPRKKNKSAANPAPACSGHFGQSKTRMGELRSENRRHHPLAKAAAAREEERSLANTCRSKAE